MKNSKLDTNENFWSLGCIFAYLGVPAMIIGDSLAHIYGVTSAIISICIGNLLLWILGLGIISMTQGKQHALDNIKKSFGKYSGLLAAFIFSLTFLMWYTKQLSWAVTTVDSLLPENKGSEIGLFLGCLTSILGLGGFKAVKWVCIIGLPILISVSIYSISINTTHINYSGNFHISLISILPVIFICLPGTVNLPTFFRHSKSKSNSVLALSLIAIFHIFFQILTIFSGLDSLITNQENISATKSATILVFTLIKLLGINLINIYFVSACWEMIFPRDYGKKKYIIFGLVGTATYLYIESSPILKNFAFLERIIEFSMALLLISLIVNFLISTAVKHRLLYLSKFLGSMSWIIGCIISIASLFQNPKTPNQALLNGVISMLLFSVATVFIEETFWSINALRKKNKI